MSAFSGLFAMWLQAAGLYAGILLALLGVVAAIWHWVNTWREYRGKPRLKVEASHLIGLGLIGIIVFAAIALAGVILSNRSTATTIASAAKEQPQQKTVYLREGHVYSGSTSPAVNPRFEATFVRSGKRCRIFVDDRYYPRGVMGQIPLIKRPRLPLTEINDFVPQQSINMPILTPSEMDGRKLWRWGPPRENQSDQAPIFQSDAWHQSRLVVICDDAPAQYFYFITDPTQMDALPDLIGQERFGFAQQWEAEDETQK